MVMDLIQTAEKEIIINFEELKNTLLVWMSSLLKYPENMSVFENEAYSSILN